eukprot:CAMPEP_0168514742 /NCGR_PEP_ID=MMETSP0405-20121227/4302_1 /TAXON_ID=498012 /ORGANISM="Trichosphaerium sp, Strain Am-I-7 wt" /LENGTH=110 /DNA_ID=CAMNT_0008533949 /DNA_START=227 /DNA_END=559 /DNA_ORIENTATION=+
MPTDSFLVAVKLRHDGYKLELLQMGGRINGGLNSNNYYADWTVGPLSEDEVEWLNNRTLEEAGLEDGDYISGDYVYKMDELMRGVPVSYERNSSHCENVGDLMARGCYRE